jgi:cobalt/nickel transport system permease protein
MNAVPEWLQQPERYEPGKDRDAFIDRTILSFLGLLSHLRARSSAPADRRSGDAAVHLVFTLGLVVLVSLSRNFTFVGVVLVYLVAALSLESAEEIVRALGTSLVVTLLTAALLVPALLQGNLYSFVMIPAKVFATVTAVSQLTDAVRWSRITGALKRFFVPDVFLLVLDVTLRYIVLLGEFSLHMFHALKLRSVGRNRDKRAALSGIAGTLFLKSKEMAEEMHSAMVCRGFDGSYRVVERFSFSAVDAVRAVVLAGLTVTFFYLERT